MYLSNTTAFSFLGFANYSVKELTPPDDLPLTLSVNGGMDSSVGISCDIRGSIVTEKASADEAECEVSLPEAAEAPVEEGEVVGKITYTFGDEKQTYEILAENAVEPTSFGRIFAYLFNSITAL